MASYMASHLYDKSDENDPTFSTSDKIYVVTRSLPGTIAKEETAGSSAVPTAQHTGFGNMPCPFASGAFLTELHLGAAQVQFSKEAVQATHVVFYSSISQNFIEAHLGSLAPSRHIHVLLTSRRPPASPAPF